VRIAAPVLKRLVYAALLIAAAITASAADATFDGPLKVDGDLRWQASLRRMTPDDCDDSRRADAHCRAELTVRVRNDSEKPLQCVAHFDSPQFDIKNRSVAFVAPGETRQALEGSIDGTAENPKYLVECHFTEQASARGPIPDYLCTREQRLELDGKAVEASEFYPPGAARRSETGIVVVEFLSNGINRRAEEARVVGTSGHIDLDRAAYELTKAFVMGKKCRGMPTRIRVRFSEPWTGPVITDAILVGGRVEILDP